MNHIIETLTKGNWRVTMHDVGRDTPVLVLAVVMEEPTDLWYLAQFCMENKLETGACLYERRAVYFPAHKIDAKAYEKILSL